MKKVYALYVNFENPENPELKITSKKHWQNQLNDVESYGDNGVLHWNENYWLSTSRSSLKGKAKEIIKKRIEYLQSQIELLEDLYEVM